ncbi:MAG: DUF108 domain-containing protein [Chlamydiae bacterium]|nr:DUF108 domain-containing protein [Chlamydiota bacterium]MBI3265788.1 DUF108 domain-containing protein [Chlamydiota bacterium]
MSAKKRISIIGCGSIGTQVALAIKDRFRPVAELVAVCEIHSEKKEIFDQQLGFDVPLRTLLECVESSDLVIEAACQEVVPDLLRQVMLLNRDLLVMSVGGLLLDPSLLEEVRSKRVRILIPSGAIGGVDLLKSAHVGKIYSVELTTKKPVEALREAPYVIQAKIDLDSVLGEKLIFEGKASEAIRAFPQNVNVAATLSLVGIGADRTRVKMMTSRHLKKNVHEIVIEGEFGRASFVIENEPSHKNPKTSLLAAFSAIATLEKALFGLEIGT